MRFAGYEKEIKFYELSKEMVLTPDHLEIQNSNELIKKYPDIKYIIAVFEHNPKIKTKHYKREESEFVNGKEKTVEYEYHKTTLEVPCEIMLFKWTGGELIAKAKNSFKETKTDKRAEVFPDHTLFGFVENVVDGMGSGSYPHIKSVSPDTARYYFYNFLKHITFPSGLKNTASNNRSLEIFKKYYRDGLTWGEVKTKASQIEDQRWMSELANAMKQVADGDWPDPIQAVFPSLLGDKTYRPILYRADRMVGGSIEYKILFHEDVAWRLKGVPNRIGTLLTLLVMATRFKYEVIDFFLNAYKKSNGERLDDRVFLGAYQSILNITSESKSRGNIDSEALIYLFRDQEKTEVKNMLGQWTGIRDDLMQGLQERDADTVKEYLENLAKANHAFIILGTKRYLEILEDE